MKDKRDWPEPDDMIDDWDAFFSDDYDHDLDDLEYQEDYGNNETTTVHGENQDSSQNYREEPDNESINNYIDPFLLNEDVASEKLSKLFGVDAKRYLDDSVELLPVSVRVRNQLIWHNIKNISVLLSYCIDDFREWRSFGKNSINELLKVIRKYISESETPSFLFLKHLEETADRTVKDTERESVIGEEFEQYKENLPYCRILVNALSKLSASLALEKYKCKLIKRLPKEILSASSRDVFCSYDYHYSFASKFVDAEEEETSFGEVLSVKFERWVRLPAYARFEKWLLLDLAQF